MCLSSLLMLHLLVLHECILLFTDKGRRHPLFPRVIFIFTFFLFHLTCVVFVRSLACNVFFIYLLIFLLSAGKIVGWTTYSPVYYQLERHKSSTANVKCQMFYISVDVEKNFVLYAKNCNEKIF